MKKTRKIKKDILMIFGNTAFHIIADDRVLEINLNETEFEWYRPLEHTGRWGRWRVNKLLSMLTEDDWLQLAENDYIIVF